MKVQIPYEKFKQRIKVRYPLLAILVVLLFLVFPYFVPYDADYSPVKSFESSHEYGHSKVGEVLKSNYEMEIEYLDITSLDINQYGSMIINSPDRDFSPDEISYLRDWINSGKNLILIGLTEPIIELYSSLFEIGIDPEDTLIDFETQHDNINFVDFTVQNHDAEYTSIAPGYADIFSGRRMTTTNQVDRKVCTIQNQVCQGNYNIGRIDSFGNTLIMFDDWFLRNKYLDVLPQNLQFVPDMLNLLGNGNRRIVIDESHYLHAPLNQRGVEAVLFSLTKADVYRGIIVFFAVVLPFILGILGGVIGKEDPRKQLGLSSKLMTRLDRLYIDKIVAAPLSLEEQVLINEKLEVLTRKHNYFQYIARLYLNYIADKGLSEFISEPLIISLLEMEKQIVSNQVAWDLIRVINYEIDKAKIKQKEEKDSRVYTSKIPGIQEVSI